MLKGLSILLVALSAALCGCATVGNSSAPPRPWQIPGDAKIIADGKPPISAAIAGPGTLYIMDENDNALVQTTTVPPSGTGLVKLDPEHGITGTSVGEKAADATVLLDKINANHRYSMWFETTGSSTTSEPTTMPSR